MPRKPINYKKVIIYKLVCNDLLITDLYVGHTKNHCLNPNDPKYNLKVYKIIRENGDWNNWSMIEIENFHVMMIMKHVLEKDTGMRY